MSKLFLTNIDLNGNQLLNSTFQKAATAPTVPTPVSGQIYFNTTDSFLYVYNGTTWDKVLESGSKDSKARNAVMESGQPSSARSS